MDKFCNLRSKDHLLNRSIKTEDETKLDSITKTSGKRLNSNFDKNV